MKKFRLLFIIFMYLSINSFAQFENYYNDCSIIKRHEMIADSLYKIGMCYMDTCIELKNSYFSSKPPIIKNNHFNNPNYRIIKDTVFDRTTYNSTKYLIYDNGGLDKILDSINDLVTILDKKEYILREKYNNDSILTGINFYQATKNGTQKIEVVSLVNSIEVSYDSEGRLYSYEEVKNDTLLRHFYYNKRGKLIFAKAHVSINNELKTLVIQYMNSKLSRLNTYSAFSDEQDGYMILGPKQFGKYRYIRVQKKGVWLYEQSDFIFGLSSVYMQSPFDEKIYFMYFFNVFNRLTSFSVQEKKNDYSFILHQKVRHGKIKKIENKVQKIEN